MKWFNTNIINIKKQHKNINIDLVDLYYYYIGDKTKADKLITNPKQSIQIINDKNNTIKNKIFNNHQNRTTQNNSITYQLILINKFIKNYLLYNYV